MSYCATLLTPSSRSLGSCSSLLFSTQLAGSSSRSQSPTDSICFSLDVSCRGGGRGGSSAYRPPRPSISRNRPQMQQQQQTDGPLMNEQIRSPNVRLLDQDQNMVGTFTRFEALDKARAVGLDLVMVSEDADPPVVRIVDYSKYRFEQQKRKKEQLRKAAANRTETKELKMRYNIDTHDYDVKLRAAQSFLLDGDRVKVTVQFRGREMEFRDIGTTLFERFIADMGEMATLDSRPKFEGKSLTMIMGPNKLVTLKMKAEKLKDNTKSKKKGEEGNVPGSENSAESGISGNDDERQAEAGADVVEETTA